MADSPAWALRITRTAQVSPNELKPHPLNWRLHPAFQRQALGGLLDQVGWVDDVLVNETTGHILDGHLRVELALERGELTVPVTYVSLTPEQEVQVLTYLDPIAALADLDQDKLAALADGLTVSDSAVQTLLDGLLQPAPGVGDEKTLRDRLSEPEPKARLEFKIVIGPYHFTVDLKTYTDWVNALYESVGNDADAVLHEVSRRLGLVGL